jgi:hypothetical protein
MIGYLVGKYLLSVSLAAIMLGAILLLFGSPLRRVLVESICCGGLLGAALVYHRFRHRNLWPLYDNLRLPRWGLLGGMVLMVEMVGISIAVWL